jgi:hypothetical protein
MIKTQRRSRLSRTDRADCPARHPSRVSGITLDFVSQSQPLEPRVVAAAEKALARQKFVTPIDVCLNIGWLQSPNVDDWRHGRVEDLDYFLPTHDDRSVAFLVHLQKWAIAKGLKPFEAEYVSAARSRRPLRFTSLDEPVLERAWRTHWISPDLPDKQAERVIERQSAPPDLVVIQPVKDFTCAECGDSSGDLLTMDDAGPLCMRCADMDHLVFLPAGDAALTRRAKKASRLCAVVVRWSRSRKRYERQGLLVEEPALDQAEQECLADSDARSRRRERDAVRRADDDVEFQRRFAAEIARLYPGCPADRAEAIARHAGLRGSGRVGRSAAGRALDDQAIALAVVASIRHQDTDYDELLMSGTARADARTQIKPAIDRVLAAWSAQ